MILNDAERAALKSGRPSIAIFFRLEVDPPVLIWLGFGDIKPGVNKYDPDGVRYQGFGAIRDLPSFKQLINGKAVRVDFSVSGVKGDILAIASGGDAQQVKGKRCAVGYAILDPDGQLLGEIKWCANYFADLLAIVQDPTDDAAAPIARSVTLSCGSLMVGRRRPSYGYFSDKDQQARFGGDRFCERTPLYATEINEPWPTFPA